MTSGQAPKISSDDIAAIRRDLAALADYDPDEWYEPAERLIAAVPLLLAEVEGCVGLRTEVEALRERQEAIKPGEPGWGSLHWYDKFYKAAARADELAVQLANARADLSRYRTWIGNCVDPLEVGVERKQAMLADIDRSIAVAGPVAAVLEPEKGAWIHVTDGSVCPEEYYPLGHRFGPKTPESGNGPWWCTTHQSHITWRPGPEKGHTEQ